MTMIYMDMVPTGDNTVMSSYAIMMLLAAGAYTAIKKTAE